MISRSMWTADTASVTSTWAELPRALWLQTHKITFYSSTSPSPRIARVSVANEITPTRRKAVTKGGDRPGVARDPGIPGIRDRRNNHQTLGVIDLGAILSVSHPPSGIWKSAIRTDHCAKLNSGSDNAEVCDAVFNPNQRKVTTRPPARRPADGADACGFVDTVSWTRCSGPIG
jgi:hypothetical protein